MRIDFLEIWYQRRNEAYFSLPGYLTFLAITDTLGLGNERILIFKLWNVSI